MRRTITGRSASRRMSLGDLRQFVASLKDLPDEATIKARVTFGKHLRSLTVEEADVRFRDDVQSVKAENDDTETASTA